MFLRKLASALVAVAATCAVLTAPAHAQVHNIMTFAGFQFVPDADFSFTSNGTGGGTLVTLAGGSGIVAIGPSAASLNGAAFLNFGPISMISGSATTTVGGDITAQFGGGTFSVTTGAGGTGTTLLTGDFGNSQFTSQSGAHNGATVQTITFGTVNYTAGTYLTDFLALYGGTTAVGSFSIGLTSITPPVSIGAANGLNSFDANGSGGTFDATSGVPEPGEYAVMGMAGLTVCGLIIRARRRRSVGGMAA